MLFPAGWHVYKLILSQWESWNNYLLYFVQVSSIPCNVCKIREIRQNSTKDKKNFAYRHFISNQESKAIDKKSSLID